MVIKVQKINVQQEFSAQITAKPEYARLLRIAEREMKEAFRLADMSQPMMFELRGLCVVRRFNALIKNQEGAIE